MDSKTRAIVLHSLRYGETRLIVTLYTEQFGRQSYIINSGRSSKSRGNISMFQPLSLLNLDVVHKSSRELQFIKEAGILIPLTSIATRVVKSTVALFMAEVIYRLIREHEQNPDLFEFIFQSVVWLENHSEGLNNFHLYFLVNLSRFIGLEPDNNYNAINTFFDMEQGKYVSRQPIHSHFFDQSGSKILYQVQTGKSSECAALRIDNLNRRKLLMGMIEFYDIHLGGMNKLKSLDVLNEVFT